MIDMQSTSIRHYSLWAMACDAVTEAEAARNKAFLTWQGTGNMDDLTRFNELDKLFTDAVKNREQVRGMKKFMRGTVTDGTDTTLKASLEDAGYGLDGRF